MTLSGVEKSIPVLIKSTTNPTWTGQGLNPVLCRERPAAACLMYGMASETKWNNSQSKVEFIRNTFIYLRSVTGSD